MKVLKIFIVMLGVFLLTACGKSDNAATSTGYASNEIEQPQIMYNDEIYYYGATGFDEELPADCVKIGTVKHTDNKNAPTENFSGARVDEGQELYYGDNTLFVKYESGYARFLTAATDSEK